MFLRQQTARTDACGFSVVLGGGCVVGTEVPCFDWRQGWRVCRVKKMGFCLHDAGCRVKFSGFCLHDAANFSGD